MKNITVSSIAFALLLLAGSPVMAENPADPTAPGSDKSPGVTPDGANAGANSDATNTNVTGGQPNTPDPTKNTPGAAPKG